jgi:hypothetical protein
MIVSELIAELELMPHDAKVLVEGCDCIGLGSRPNLQDDGRVLITRGDE